jgi:cation diffusion facilitator family transporter
VSGADRSAAIQRVLLIALGTNLAIAAAKILLGRATHVISMTADGVHSTLDGFNNLVGMVALASAHRPPDADHPYGHRKFETFAALGIAVVLALVGVGLTREAVARLTAGRAPEASVAGGLVMAGTIALNLFLAQFQARRGRELGSEFLLANAQEARADIFVSLSVLGALAAIALRAPIFDLVATLVIVLFIAGAAWTIARESLDVLADAAAIEPARVEAVVRAIPGVRSCHKVRTRGPAGHVFVDLHIQVDPYLTTVASHEIVHETADAIRAAIPGVEDVVIHTEPDTGAPDFEAIDPRAIERVVRGVAGVCSCHKIRTRGPRGAAAIDLHIQVDPRMTTEASHELGHRVADALRRELAGVADVLVHAEPFRGS